MALVCLCRGNFYWPPHTTILFCSIFLDKIVLDTLKSRYHRSAPLGIEISIVKFDYGRSICKRECQITFVNLHKATPVLYHRAGQTLP